MTLISVSVAETHESVAKKSFNDAETCFFATESVSIAEKTKRIRVLLSFTNQTDHQRAHDGTFRLKLLSGAGGY